MGNVTKCVHLLLGRDELRVSVEVLQKELSDLQEKVDFLYFIDRLLCGYIAIATESHYRFILTIYSTMLLAASNAIVRKFSLHFYIYIVHEQIFSVWLKFTP